MLLRFFIFSPLVKLYLNSNFWFLRLNKRLAVVILEMWFTLSMFFPYLIILMIPGMIAAGSIKSEAGWSEMLGLAGFNLMMIVLINKDFYKGQSPVHRKLGYQVVDSKTNLPASKLKCMLRNVTASVWPLEVVFFFGYPERRLGDFIAGTSLVQVAPTDPESILEDIRKATFDKDSLAALVLSAIWVIVLMRWLDVGLRWM